MNLRTSCSCIIARGYILVTTMQSKQPIREQKSMQRPIISCNHYICMGPSGISYFNRFRWGKTWEYPEYGEVCRQCLGHFPMFCSHCHLMTTHLIVMCLQGVVLRSVSPEIEPDKNQSSSYEDEHEPCQEDVQALMSGREPLVREGPSSFIDHARLTEFFMYVQAHVQHGLLPHRVSPTST